MKTLTLAASNEIAKKVGAAPIVLVQIEIPNNYVHISDKTVTRDNIIWQGKIQALGSINTEKRTDLVGSVSTVQVTLDDSDEVFRGRLNSERWLARKVKIFHSFDALNETFLIFAGKVSTPFSWNENDRSLSLDVISDVVSQQAGLEITDESFAGGYNGGVVPLAFGTIIAACPVKIYENINANVLTPFVRFDSFIGIAETSVQPYGSWSKSPYQVQYGNYLYKSGGQYIVRNTTYSPSFDVDSSNKFPQNTEITLSVSNFIGKIKGSFNSNTFTVTALVDLLKTLSTADVSGQSEPGKRPAYIIVNDSFDYNFTTLVFKTKNTSNEDANVLIQVLSQDDQKVYLSAEPPKTWSSIEVRVTEFMPNSFLVAPLQTVVVPAGTKVFLDDNGIIEAYAVSATPFSNLVLLGHQVFNGKRNLRVLPTQFYNIDTNFKGQGFTAITIPKALSAYKVDVSGQNFHLSWEDKFYVSFQSGVSGNVSDVIKYIVQHYTDLVIDQTTFDEVFALVANYPSNFMLSSAPDALKLISEICYQARCGISIKNGIVFLKYLSKEPAVQGEALDSQIVEGSMILSYTDESAVRTSLTGKYEKDCIDHLQKKVVYKNNVSIYGLLKEEKTYYIYNSDDLVKKSNSFWGYRISNQWKLLSFKTMLTNLAFEQGDCIEIRSTLYTGKSIIEKVEYDSDKNEIRFEVWTPVIAGTNTQSSSAWTIDASDVVPSAPVIYAPPADKFFIQLPTSDYGVHDPSQLKGTVTSDEDANGLVPFNGEDGSTGVAENINTSSKIKTGDQIVVFKDKYNKFYTQAPGGGGGVPVTIYDVDPSDPTIVFVDVYGKGYALPATIAAQQGKLINNPADLVFPTRAIATLIDGVYTIDLSQISYKVKATSDADATGKFTADLIDPTTLTTFKSVQVTSVNSVRVKSGTETLVTNQNGAWICEPGIDGLIPVTVTAYNLTGGFLIDVYELGFGKPATETLVDATMSNTYYKDSDFPFKTFATRTAGKYEVTQKSKTTYFAVATSDSGVTGLFNANLTNLDDNTTYKSITNIQIVDNKGTVKTGQKVIVTKNGTKWFCIPTTTQTVSGGTTDTGIVDGVVATKVGKVGDIIKVSDDNKAALNMDTAAVVANAGGNAILLSSLFQIVAGQLCIKTTAPFTDGTAVAPMELALDGAIFRPSATLLKD